MFEWFRIVSGIAMCHAVLSRGIVSLILIAGMTTTARAEGTTYQPDQHIMVRTGSKGERRCVIISTTKRPDGVVEYRVKAIDNGEVITILDRAGTSVARSKPVENEAPKVSFSNDPLLASSLRQPAPATAQTPDFAVPTPDSLAARPQPRVSPRTQAANVPAPVVVKQDPRSRQSGDLYAAGFSTVGNGPVPLQSNADQRFSPNERVAMVGTDPVPLQQVRYIRETVTTTAADPASIGFAIPVANSRQIQMPVKRQAEREDQTAIHAETLKNALQPSARLAAVDALTENVGINAGKVKTLLMGSAVNDPAAVVRAASIRGLLKMGVRDADFRALLTSAKQDPDARVRIEVDQAEEMGR